MVIDIHHRFGSDTTPVDLEQGYLVKFCTEDRRCVFMHAGHSVIEKGIVHADHTTSIELSFMDARTIQDNAVNQSISQHSVAVGKDSAIADIGNGQMLFLYKQKGIMISVKKLDTTTLPSDEVIYYTNAEVIRAKHDLEEHIRSKLSGLLNKIPEQDICAVMEFIFAELPQA